MFVFIFLCLSGLRGSRFSSEAQTPLFSPAISTSSSGRMPWRSGPQPRTIISSVCSWSSSGTLSSGSDLSSPQQSSAASTLLQSLALSVYPSPAPVFPHSWTRPEDTSTSPLLGAADPPLTPTRHQTAFCSRPSTPYLQSVSHRILQGTWS